MTKTYPVLSGCYPLPLLNFIYETRKKTGFAPKIDEIASKFKLHYQEARNCLISLEEEGYITRLAYYPRETKLTAKGHRKIWDAKR